MSPAVEQDGVFEGKSALRLLQLLLLMIFLWQMWEASVKYNDGQISTMASYTSMKTLPMPSVVICSIPFHGSNENLTKMRSLKDMYYSFQQENNPSPKLIGTHFLKDVSKITPGTFGHNWSDPNDLKNLGYAWNDVWQPYYVVAAGYNMLTSCHHFKPPFEVHPSPYNALAFALHFDNTSQGQVSIVIKLQERDQITTAFDRHLGGMYIMPENTLLGRVVVYDMTLSNITNLNRKDNPCNEENNSKFLNCFEDYLDRELDCILPWRNKEDYKGKTMRECDRIEDSKKLENISLATSFDDFDTIKKKTKCVNNCQYIKYQATRVMDSDIMKGVGYDSWDHDTLLLFSIRISDPYVKSEKEVSTYDINSLTGDVGGFLGLLLGFSMVDIYLMMIRSVKKIIRNTF